MISSLGFVVTYFNQKRQGGGKKMWQNLGNCCIWGESISLLFSLLLSISENFNQMFVCFLMFSPYSLKFVPKQSTFKLGMNLPYVWACGHFYTVQSSGSVGESPAWRHDTCPKATVRAASTPSPPQTQMLGALSSQDCLVVPCACSEDTSPGLLCELNVDTVRERWLFPASLYGSANSLRDYVTSTVPLNQQIAL